MSSLSTYIKRPLTIWILAGGVVLLLLGIGFFLGRQTDASLFADQNTQTPVILAQKTLNKTFSFPVMDGYGQFVTNVSYTITTVDKQNQVIIKGERASVVSGKSFFIVNMKLTNTSAQTIQLNSRDYIRMSEGNNNELFAADLYNDPIVIQPISTEYTHIGFPVDSGQTTFILHVGPFSGPKTDIPVHFR